MSLDLTFIGQIVVFLTLVFLMTKYLYGPLNDVMEQRTKKIADGLAAAEAGLNARSQAEAEAAQEIEVARLKAQTIVASAEKRAAELREEILVSARGEAEQIVKSARDEVGAEVQRARQALHQEVASLALLAAERILEAEVDGKKHSQLIEQEIASGLKA